MKSIQNQYRDLKEGRMSQHNFMRNLRMSMPQHITNVTSFNDAVKILKNKAILSEATVNSPEDVKEQWFEEFQNAIENMDLSPEKKAKAMKALDHVDVIDMYGMFQPGPGANAFIGDIDDILARAGDKEENDEDADLAAMLAKYGNEDLGPEKYKFQDFPGAISEAKKKKEAKTELHPNQIHPQELRMGIKVELEHTDDLDKAKKIALDHLAENPFYYTALKLAGVESPSAPKVKAPVEKKTRKKKEVVELVDKANAMQKVKMPKALQEAKFSPLPGEEPNAVVKQAMEWVEANLPSISDEIEFQQSRFRPDEAILRYGYWDILPEDAVAKLKSKFDVEADSDEMDDQLPINYYRLKLKKPSFRPGVDLGKSFDKFKSTLEEVVREVIAETFDGRDNVTDVAGHQLDEK